MRKTGLACLFTMKMMRIGVIEGAGATVEGVTGIKEGGAYEGGGSLGGDGAAARRNIGGYEIGGSNNRKGIKAVAAVLVSPNIQPVVISLFIYATAS